MKIIELFKESLKIPSVEKDLKESLENGYYYREVFSLDFFKSKVI